MGRSLMLVVLASAALWAQGSGGQGANGPSDPPGVTGPLVETDPIRCWWRTSTGAVRVGELFSLTLTCAVLDSEAVQVVPDESRLSPAVVRLTPFEVIGGTHPADLYSGTRRFFQYHYSLRIISPDAVGADVALPNFEVAYRVNSRLAGNAAQEGRELTYLLPTQLVRVLSTVPEEAPDIRDTAAVDFGRLEALAFRAGVLRIAGWTLTLLGGLVTVLAVAGLARRSGQRTAGGARLLSDRAIARLAASELAAVEHEAGAQGWNEGLVERALAAARLATAQALGATVHQHRESSTTGRPKAAGGEGRLATRTGWRRKDIAAVSASATSDDIARALESDTAARRQELDDVRGAMATFSAAVYHSTPVLDQSALDSALAAARALAQAVKSDMNAPARILRYWMSRPPEPQQPS